MSAVWSLYLPLFVVCLSIPRSGAQEDDSKCLPKSLDKCGSDYFLFNHQEKIATGDMETKKQCDLFMDQITCTNQVVKSCWSLLFSTIVSRILHDLFTYIDGTCTSGSPLNQLYKDATGCLNKAGPSIHKETQDFRMRLHSVAKDVSYKDRIDYACCAYSTFRKQAMDVVNKECPGDDKAMRLYDDMFNQTVGRGIMPACAGFDWDTMWCKALPQVSSTVDAKQTEGLAGPIHDILKSWEIKYT
ncbi:uncharacterized protein LOC135398246 isoform X1 [Ornithodoros turicata]|uniref:uncharacterized protein LOC135398246 isoform X1 n=1 Tax=Ornithodoros turicata TaxID=34597 RepID=UPI003139C437